MRDFITIVTQGRECLFGEVVDGEMRLNDAGRIVEEMWLSLPERFPEITLGAAVVMTNHFLSQVTFLPFPFKLPIMNLTFTDLMLVRST